MTNPKKNGQGWRRAFIMAYLRPHVQKICTKFMAGNGFANEAELIIPLLRMAFLSSGFASTLQSLMSGSMVIGDNSFRSSNPCAKLNLPFAFQRLAHSDVVFSVLTLWFQKHSLMTLFRVIELTDIDYIISNAKEDNNLSVVLHKEKHFSHAKTYDPLLLTEFTKDILLRGELAKSITRLKTVGPLIDPLKMSFPSLKVSAFDLNQCFLTSKPMHKHVSDGISDWARNPPSLPIECLCLENASRFDIISTFHNVCPTLKQATIYCLLVPDPNIEDRVIVDPQFRWKAEQLKAFAPNLKEVIGTAQFNVHYSEVDTYFRLKIIDKIRQLLLAVEKLRCPWAKTEVLTNIAFVTEENRLRISRAKHLRFLDMFVEDTRLHNELKLESIKLMMGTNLRKRLTRRIARKGNPAKTENMTLDETTEESPTVESENERRRPILESQLASIMNAFVDHVASLGFEGLRCEHAQLKAFLPDNRSTFAFEANRMRNRYTDQLCYDATRVKLTYNVPPDVDYIHANVVDIPGVGNRFICTQEKTVCIVKLCHFEEDGKSKCAQYFPQIEGETKEYGYFVVRHVKYTNNINVFCRFIVVLELEEQVYEIVKDLRCRRHNSVQTEAQYLFIHRTLCEYMKSKGLQRSAIPQFLTEYAIHMKNLANPIPLPIQQAPIQQPPVQQPQRPAPLLQQQQVQSTPQLAAQPALIMQQQPQT
ncbi:Receptor-type tyrosine-protein phosphatase T [Aphelenchoides besseyi]|nr:Receptor-type tyrosine-protein phosphatase T [Aphelenchoides besseyi]